VDFASGFVGVVFRRLPRFLPERFAKEEIVLRNLFAGAVLHYYLSMSLLKSKEDEGWD
jgi:hypothetical protein